MDTLEKERIVKKNIIDIFKEYFNPNLTEDEILQINPKEVYENASSYYESILDVFLIETEHESDLTRGCVKDTVATVTKLWSKTPHSFYPWEGVN